MFRGEDLCVSRITDPNFIVSRALLLAGAGLLLNAVLATAECKVGEAWGVCFREWLNATGVWVASAAALLIGWWHFGPLYQQASIEHGRDLAVQRAMLARIQRECVSLEGRLLDRARIVANPGRYEPPRSPDQEKSDVFLRQPFLDLCTSLRELTFDCIEQWTVLEIPILHRDELEPHRSEIVKRLASLDLKISRVKDCFNSSGSDGRDADLNSNSDNLFFVASELDSARVPAKRWKMRLKNFRV